MKILTVVSSPGPAQSLGLAVKALREAGQEVELINVSNDSLSPGLKANPSGSGEIFQGLHLYYKEAGLFGLIEDYFNIQDTFADRIINEVHPQKVLTGTYRDVSGTKITLEDAVIFSARRMGIPAFQFVDLWDNWFPKKSLNIIPDTFLVHDVWATEIMKNRSPIQEERFSIIGNPALENFIQKKTSSKRFKKSDFGLAGKRVIAYFSQCVPIRNEISLPWVINCLGDNDVLVFRRHPRDRRDYTGYLNSPKIIELNIPSDDILDFTDICITHTSTMGIKAAFLQIKTINIILENEFSELLSLSGKYPLDLMGGSQQVKNELEFKEAIGNNFIISDNFKRMSQELMEYKALNKIIRLLTN